MNTTSSPVIRSSVASISPLLMLVALYVLLAGHNRPGGGFAAGLLLGAGIAVRGVAGLGRPRRGGPWLGAGGLICTGCALAPLLWGAPVLDQVVVETSLSQFGLGQFGTLKTGSALVFDLGVVAIVVGLVVAALEGLALGVHDGSQGEAAPAAPSPASPSGDRS